MLPVKYDLQKIFHEDEAFKLAKEVTKKYAKTFYYAAKFLPRNVRRGSYILYTFSRQTDNLADDYPEDTLEQKSKIINDWKIQINKAFETEDSNSLILNTYSKLSKQKQIPKQLALELVEGVETDLTKKNYKNFEELEKYCYLVASVPGLMLTHLIGFSSKDAFPHAISMGKAMQLTNILRDIKEDWQNGRVYLPQQDLDKYGITQNDFETTKGQQKFVPLIKEYIIKARQYYIHGYDGLHYLEPKSRFAAKMAGVIYEKILDVIEKQDYKVFEKRAFVRKREKLLATVKSIT
jgi:phytoene synthase